MKSLSPARRAALKIIGRKGPIRPREFAAWMWPKSDGWKRHSRSGPKGSHQGGGMYLAAGGFLGKLAREGLISRPLDVTGTSSPGYTLTERGWQALDIQTGLMPSNWCSCGESAKPGVMHSYRECV